ncbi:MAG: hypothetical protein HYR49_08635 [Gammaproteobacteria bacterium]|nr:hypothetical protein [Gammaproteobacteria bacterium]
MEQPTHPFDRIAPAPVKLGNAPGEVAPPVTGTPGSPLLWPAIVIGLLTLAALFVIFVLPQWQGRTESAPPKPAVSKPDPRPEPVPKPGDTQSELTKTEIGAARAAAQELLERLRELDQALLAMGVQSWAGADYRAGADSLAAGDRFYRSLDYASARDAFQSALPRFKALIRRADAVFTDSMARGNQALNEGNGQAAAGQFHTALLIRPDDPGAHKGAERAGHMDQVIELIRRGEELSGAGDLPGAAEAYQKASDLDPEFQPARERLQNARSELGARAYRAAMSAGFAALDNGDLGAARGHFSAALRLRPGSPEAADALRQAETGLTSAEIGRHLAAAQAAEQSEDWAAAISAYEAALKLDANLLAAQSGIENATRRSDLDRQLSLAIARPERLSDDTVYEETTALLLHSGEISGPGTKLKRQIAALTALLQEARVPIAVTFVSDGKTEVTVYRVGKLGRFVSKEITLRPGRHVIVGTRPGFRDARVELTLAAGAAPAPVEIRCTETVGAGT